MSPVCPLKVSVPDEEGEPDPASVPPTAGAEFVTRQPVERVLTYYQRPLIEAGLVVSTKTEQAAAEPAAA